MDQNPSDEQKAEFDQQPGPGPEGGEPQLSDAEREMLEQQMREIRVEDLLTQTVASVLNLSARRIVKEDEVDLDQARLGIDAVRAIIPLLPAEVGEAVREPLSQVQMLYAQRSGDQPAQAEGGDQPAGTGEAPPQAQPGTGAQPGGETRRPEGSGGSGLWTPGGS